MSSSGPSTCRRSARSRNVSESSESAAWFSSDGRGNVGQSARQFRCPADSGSHSDNNSPERVKRKKRRKNVHNFSAEERKRAMKRRVAELVKQNRLGDELLRLKLKDSRVPLVLLKRLEREPISQPKQADEPRARSKLDDESLNQKKLENVSLNQKKLADVPQAQVWLSNEAFAPEKRVEETRAHVKLAVELPAKANPSDEPRPQKRPVGRPPKAKLAKEISRPKLAKEISRPKLPNEPSQSKLSDETPQPKLAKETPQPKLAKETPQPKLAKETQPKLAKETPQPKLAKEMPQPKLAKETPKPKLAMEIPQLKLAKETPQPKLAIEIPQLKLVKKTPQAKVVKETPQAKLVKETPQAKLVKETPLLKLANDTPQPKLSKEPPEPKLAKDSSQPKVTKDSSQSKLAKEPSQPKLAEKKSAEEQSEEKKEYVQQECAQMSNVILPRKIDPSILRRKVFVRINKRQTDRLVAKKLSLQRRLLKELGLEKERTAPIAEPTLVNSGDSDKCATRLTEKSNDFLTDVNKCTKNPIESGKKQSNNDRLPEKLLEDNSRCMLNSLSLSQTSVAENQPESSKSFVHSNRKNKHKTIDQINDKVSVDLVAIEPKCIKDTTVNENQKHSDDSRKDVKKYSKNSVKEIEKLSEQIIVKSKKTNPEISGDSNKKRLSAKEIRERRIEASRKSKVLKNPSQIRTRPRRNLASKSDNSVDSSFDSNEKLSKKLNKEVIQHNLKCQAESDMIVKKNEAEKCDIQSTVEKTLDSKDKSIKKCSKTSESDENLKYSKGETECNKVLEKSNIEEKLHSEGVIENRVVENFVKCGDNLPEKLNKNVNKRIKNQTEKSIKSTRNIQSKIEKQADNAQENHGSSQNVVKENNECQSKNLDIVIEKYNDDSKEPIERTKRNLEKSVTLVEESSENDSKNSIGKQKRSSKKSVQSSVDDKTESPNSISDAVKGVCEKTVQISVENKNENLSKHFDDKIKKNIKVAIEQVKYQKTNVDTLCDEKLSKNAEKTEHVEKHNKKHPDAKDKEENQISFNLTDVNQRPKRNIIKRNLEIYTNSCTLSKTENEIDKHNERLLEDLNKNDTADVSKRKSRKLLNKEEHLENVEQSKLENEILPVEKSNEKVPEMLNVNITDMKPETAIGKRSKRIIAHNKNVKSTENLISSDVDNKESGMKENENQVAEIQKMTESCEETKVQNNMIAIPVLPQKLDKMNVNLIENVPDSVHNVILETITKDLNEASSNTVLAVSKRRGRRRKSLPDATEKIISNIVKSASIPDDLQNQIELQNDFVMSKDMKDNIEKSEQSSVNLVKKCTRLQVTIEKRITRNSVPEDKSVQIATENKIDLISTKADSNKSISDKTESNENLYKIDLVIDHQEKPIKNSETIATSVQNDGDETTDPITIDKQNTVKEDIKIQIVNQKRVTRKDLLNQHEMCTENSSSVNSEDTEASTIDCKTRIVTKSIPDTDQNKSDALHKNNSDLFYEEQSTDNSEETVQHSIDINGHLENTRAIITEAVQNDVDMNNEQNEDLQKAIKEIPKSENKNQKRVTRKASPNKREKQLRNSILATFENIESSADECKKRMSRKSIPDKTKSIETLHKAESILDHQGKPMENTEDVSIEVMQRDFEKSDQHSEDLQKAFTENTKSQIVNQKRLAKKVNKHEKLIESIPAISEDTEESTDKTKKRVKRKSVPDISKVADSLHNDESILDHPEKPIENGEEIIKEDVQNVEINGYTEQSQKAIIENTNSQIVNKKRVTRRSSLNKREKQIESTPTISEDTEDSTDKSKKRVARKSIPDKSKIADSLHNDESILDHPEKPIENGEEIIKEDVQNVEINGYTEQSQKAITNSQIVNQKRVTRRSSSNKREKQIKSTPAISEDTEDSTDKSKKRVARKSIPDKNKIANSLHNDESILDHLEKPIENGEEIIKEDVQNVEINRYTEESQKAVIKNAKSQIVNQKRVTRRSSPNKREKQIENKSANSEDTEDSTDKSKKRVARNSIPDKNKIADSLHNDESILDHPEKPIENGEEIIKEDVQNVEINGYTEESQKAVIENAKSQIVNQKRVTRRSSPNKHEKQIENKSANSEDTEDSTDKTKKRVTRKLIPDKNKAADSLHNDELILDHPEKPNENDEEIIKEDVQNDVEINGHTEESQKAIVENLKSPLLNEKRVTWKSLPNKHEKLIENSTYAISEDIETSLDECKNKSGSVKRTTRKERLEKCVDSVSSSDDKIAEEPQKINKDSSKSEKVSRKVSPDKYDKQTENLIINNLETVMNSIDEEDKIFSETLDNKENTKTQIEVNARVTRNSSLKKDRHTKNLIENNVDCVHNEDNKDRSLENVVSTVKVFSKNLTDNKKFRKMSVDKVNEIQTENLIDNSSASLQNLIEENDQKQFEGSLKRQSKEFTEGVKRKSTQNDYEVNSVNMQHSLDEKHFSAIDDNKKSTIIVENNKRVTRKSAEMHSEEIAKDSAKLTDHNLLPEASEKSVAVCEESDKDSSKIVQSDVSKSLAEAKGLVNSIKSFNEHNDTCTEILQVFIDVNSESQPNKDKLMCSEPLTEKSAKDTKTTVAVEIATDSVEKSEKSLECSAASLAESSPVQQTIVNNKNDSVSEEQSTRCSKRVSLRAFRKVKENKPVPISDSSVSTIEPTTNKEENHAESLNENLIHTVVESIRDNTDTVTELAADNLISSNTVIEKNVISDIQKIDDSSNISSPNVESNEKLTLNSSQKSNENDLESACENANATITESIVDKLDENMEKLQPANATVTESIADKLDENVEQLQPANTTVTESIADKLDENVEQLQDTNETAPKDTELIENQEEVNEDSSNQDSNETSSENSFKSALDVVPNEVETLVETSSPVEEHEVSDLNNLEIPHLDSLCSVEAFPANTAEEPLEEALNNLELPSSESLNSLENSLIPTFESPNLDSAIETGLEDAGNSSETCSKTLETSAEKTPENEESTKKKRLATLLELKRKCTENLDKKQAVDCQNNLNEAIDTLIVSGSLDSIDPSSDSCLGNVTENEENFESLSDEFDNENLASRLANLNDLKIPPLTTEQDSSLVFDEENKKEKPAAQLDKSFLEMNAMTCMYCDKCFTINRELKKHVKVQHRQRLVIKITKTDSNEHKTQLVEPTENSVPEQEPPLVADVDSIPPNERFPMVAEEETITDGEIKIIVKKESGSKNSHVVKEIKITPKSSDGGSSIRIPGFSPALSDMSAGGSSINSPALDTSGIVVKKSRGRPRKYPIFTENEIMAKQMAAQVLAQEQERMKRQLQFNAVVPVFEPVESIIPPFDERAKAKSLVEEPGGLKERVKRKRKVRVFDNDDTEEEEIPSVPKVKKRRGRPPRKKPEQLLQELNERLQQAQKSTQPQSVNKSPNLQQAGESQQVQEQNVPKSLPLQQSPKSQPLQEPPKSQPLQEQPKSQPAVEQMNVQPAVQEIPKSRVPQEPPKTLQRPIPALVPSSMPIRLTSSLPLPLLTPTLTPTLRTTTVPPLKQTPIPPLKQMAIPPPTHTAIPPLTQTAIPPLRQTSMPFLIPNLTPTMSMPSLSPLTRVSSPLPEGPDTDEKRRKLVESLQEFIVIGPEEKKRRLEGASGQEEAEDQAAAPESPDATDVSKPEKGLLTRKFGMTKELVVRLTKIDTVPKDCEDFNGDVDDSERIDGDPKESSDERLRRKLKPKLPNEEGEESSRESLSSVVRMNLRRKLENNNNHVNDVEKCLATTDSPRTQPSDAQTPEAATSDAAKRQSDPIVQQEATNNQLVVTPRRPTMDKVEADQSQKAKLMMLMNATTPAEATNKAASNSVTETPRAQPQSQPQVQMQLQQQPQNQLQVHQQSQPLPLAQMQHQAHPQPQPQVQLPVQTQPQTVMQLQQPQQFCILFIPDYDGNGPRDVAPTATIVNFQPVPDNEIHNKPLIYMPTTPTKISVDDHAKAYVCANCTKVLDLIGRLEANVGMTEEDKSAITCPYCSNHFQSLFYLEYHVMHEHLKCENEKQCRHSRVNSLRIPNHEVATEFESYITFALKCRSCYDIFGSVLALNDHVMHKHKTLVRLRTAAPAIAGPNAYPGPFVGKNGAIGAVLQCPSDCVCRIGIRSTDTPLQRQQMLKRCPNAMRRLEKIEPAAYEVYTCTLCKSTFLMKDEVVDHLMKMHEVSCKFPCYTCLTSFRSLQIQENHRCSETTLQDFDKLLNIAILPTNVGGKEHNNKFLEREDSSTDEYGAMKTPSPRAPPASTITTTAEPIKNGLKRKNGATIAALSQLLSKKPKLMNTIAQPVLPSKRKRKRACPKCKKRFAYRKSLHDHVIYEHIMKGDSADGPKKTAVELLMLLSNNRANYKRIEELAEMLNGYTDEDGVSLRKLAMMEENELEIEEESTSQSTNKEPRTGADVAQCIRCKKLFSPSVSGYPGQSSSQDDEQRKPLLCDNCEGIAGPKMRRRGPVNNGQYSDDDSSDDSQSTSSQMLTFACKKCSDTFPTAIELKSHKLAVHAKQGVEHLYSCDICTKSFAAPRMLEKHKKIHRESVLDDSAKPEDETNRSSSQNSGDNSKDSEANDSLNDKMNSSNRRDSSDSSGAGSKEPEEQLLDCSFCEEVCSSKVSLKNHLKREHGRRASICQFCNGLLIDTSEVRHMLDYHIVPSKTNTRQTIVRNNGNILHCGDSCMQDDVDELIRTLGKHRLQSLMVYHDFEGKCNNAIMRCPICPELFATRESCRFHYVWIHDDNCLLCDETFRSGSSACQHKVDAHTSTASYLWCIQRLVTAIVNTLNLDPDQPSHVLYQVLAMRLDDEEEEARIACESTAGDTAEKGTNEEAPSATERFLEEVLSEDQLPDSGNMIEVVIGREDSEDDLLSMLNLSPNYETCEQLPNASAAPPEEEEEEEVPSAPTSPTMAASSVIVPVPTTPTATASTLLATTVSSPVAPSPTTVTTASPVLGNYCASGVYLCKHSDGDEQFVLVVAGEDEITYKNDIGSLAVRISETCEVFTLDEITEMLRVHFANLNQNSDGSA